jgi:hypothetical protein
VSFASDFAIARKGESEWRPIERFAAMCFVMTTKILSLGLAVVGLGFLAIPNADAHMSIAAPSTLALPSLVRVNQLNVEVQRVDGRESRHYSHRPRYRTVRRVYYRHGRRVVVYRRVRYGAY